MSDEQELPADEISRTLREMHARQTAVGHKAGFYVCPITNTPKPIPGSISGYDANNQPVIAPMLGRKPQWERLSIGDLLAEQEKVQESNPNRGSNAA